MILSLRPDRSGEALTMHRWTALAVAVVGLLPSLLTAHPGAAATPELTFEDRVHAQEAIERVYYRHEIDATKPLAGSFLVVRV